ncbi:MAG TPA: AraC family transcriptional regulator, partial [Chitinophagaceae bacterium]|nr:AraC family transcriptional regulator [Chitinophagaceae bacterium]
RNLLAARERMRARFSLQLNGQPVPGRKTEAALEENMSTRLDREFMGKLLLLVDEHMDDPGFGVDMLSRKMAMSAPILYRKLKALTGLSVNEFVKSLRLQKAATLLMERQHTVNEVSFMVGYNDRKYFSREFKKQFGQTPTEYVEVNGTSDK